MISWRIKLISESTYEQIHWQPFLYFYSIEIKIRSMCFHFLPNVHVDTICQKFFTTRACFCFYVMEFKKQKNVFCTSEALLCFTQKNNSCIMNKTNWFDFIHYTEIICFSKNVIFLYFLKIFLTMLHVKIFSEYCIILHIFRKSLCVTSP